MLSFHQVVEDDFKRVNKLIVEQLHSDVDLVENIGHYLVEAGGKRLRPLLVLLCANLLGCPGRSDRHLELSAIIEFIHTATLLHDDVVDLSNMRRGRLTANAKWGNAPSVLVGDFLYSRAFQMMVAIGSMDIMHILSNTTNTISEGEVQQLVNARDPSVNEGSYLTVIYKKTAALFEAACETAAVLSGAPAKQRSALKSYGCHLGLAFQLVDDALDYQGDSQQLGKNVGDDLAEGKPTLPLIHAMAKGDQYQAALIADAIREGDSAQLDAIVKIVETTGALDYTMEQARKQSDLAIQQLAQMQENDYRKALIELAEFSVNRNF